MADDGLFGGSPSASPPGPRAVLGREEYRPANARASARHSLRCRWFAVRFLALALCGVGTRLTLASWLVSADRRRGRWGVGRRCWSGGAEGAEKRGAEAVGGHAAQGDVVAGNSECGE